MIMILISTIITVCDSDSSSLPPDPEITELINYSTNPEGGDQIHRAFYIEEYPGTTLDKVFIWMKSSTTGTYTIDLTARQDTYEGSLTGTVSLSCLIGIDFEPFTFNFSDTPVIKNSILTFRIERTAGADERIFYATECDELDSLTPEEILIIQTNGSSPPLSTFRRDGVAVIVSGRP